MPRREHTGRLRRVDEGALAGISLEHVRFTLQRLRSARNRDVHEAARAFPARRELLPFAAEIVRDVEVHVAIAIEVAKGTPRTPSGVRGLAAVCERAAASVVPQDVPSERR